MLYLSQVRSDSRLFVVYEILANTVKTLDREGVGRVYLGILDGLYPSINRAFGKEARKCAR